MLVCVCVSGHFLLPPRSIHTLLLYNCPRPAKSVYSGPRINILPPPPRERLAFSVIRETKMGKGGTFVIMARSLLKLLLIVGENFLLLLFVS